MARLDLQPPASLGAQPVERGWAGLPGNDEENGSDSMAVNAYGPPLTCLWLESANPPARPHATDPWARLRAGPVPTCRSVRLLLPLPLSSSVICWCKGLSRFPKATGGCLSQLQPCGVTSPDTKSSSGPWHLLKENGDVGGGGMSSSRWMRL